MIHSHVYELLRDVETGISKPCILSGQTRNTPHCRLTVPYLFVLGVVEVTMMWFYYNSVFEPPTADHVSCPSYWWRNALYINTLFPVKDMVSLQVLSK
jgi:hypothetical protein